MESQPRNPEFRIDSENFHPCITRAVNWLYWNSHTWLSSDDNVKSK